MRRFSQRNSLVTLSEINVTPLAEKLAGGLSEAING